MCIVSLFRVCRHVLFMCVCFDRILFSFWYVAIINVCCCGQMCVCVFFNFILSFYLWLCVLLCNQHCLSRFAVIHQHLYVQTLRWFASHFGQWQFKWSSLSNGKFESRSLFIVAIIISFTHIQIQFGFNNNNTNDINIR